MPDGAAPRTRGPYTVQGAEVRRPARRHRGLRARQVNPTAAVVYLLAGTGPRV